MNIKELNQKIQLNFQNNDYLSYLKNNGFDDQYVQEMSGDNLLFKLGEELVYSVRIDLNTGIYKHLDFYQGITKRPYKRVYLNQSGQVINERYYELGTWTRSYDVYLDHKFSPVYTVEYFDGGKERYIAWTNNGQLFYDKVEFLQSFDQ